MAKYIKHLYLENQHSFEPHVLTFNQGVNLIIGPKGGGKSTLMEILNNYHKNASFSKKQNQKFSQFQKLEPTKMVYSDDSIITLTQLSAKNEQVLHKNFISQDDQLKTNMHELDEVKQAKQKFIENIYLKHQHYFQNDFDNYLQSMQKLLSIYNNSNISYSNISKLSVVDNNKTKLITKMDINVDEINQQFTKINNLNNEQITEINELLQTIELSEKNLNKIKYLTFEPIWTPEHKKNLVTTIKKLEKQNKELKKLQIYLQNYQKSLEYLKNKNANQETNVEKSTRFKEQMLTFVSNCTKAIIENQQLFTNLYVNNSSLELNYVQKGEYGLTYEINCNLNVWNEINDDDTLLPMSKILETVLYKPSKSDRNFFNWIETLISRNSLKKTDTSEAQKKLKEAICKLIAKHVVVKYENENYENLSLGQRTSLMLENKLKNIDETQILFLDQPEDNIDNYTIANVLVKIINEKQQKNELNQLFVVTHNANFGILLNPSTLTIANISKEGNLDIQQWYEQYFSLEQIDANIDKFKNKQSYYLEGGNKILEKRYNKLVGNIYEN